MPSTQLSFRPFSFHQCSRYANRSDFGLANDPEAFQFVRYPACSACMSAALHAHPRTLLLVCPAPPFPVCAPLNLCLPPGSCTSYSTGAPVAPFPWVPGTRHSPKEYAWPPAGIVLVSAAPHTHPWPPAHPHPTLTPFSPPRLAPGHTARDVVTHALRVLICSPLTVYASSRVLCSHVCSQLCFPPASCLVPM
jgi:hypothetical protein